MQVSNKIRVSKMKRSSVEQLRQDHHRNISLEATEASKVSVSPDQRLYKRMEAAAKLKEDEQRKEKELRLMQIKLDR